MRGSSKENLSVEEWGLFPWSHILQSVVGSLDRLARVCETFSGGLALEKSSVWLKPCASLQ